MNNQEKIPNEREQVINEAILGLTNLMDCTSSDIKEFDQIEEKGDKEANKEFYEEHPSFIYRLYEVIKNLENKLIKEEDLETLNSIGADLQNDIQRIEEDIKTGQRDDSSGTADIAIERNQDEIKKLDEIIEKLEKLVESKG